MNDVSMASELVKVSKSLMAAYPDSAPTEQERKKWREDAEKRRRKDGIRPRKGATPMRFRVISANTKSIILTAGEFPGDTSYDLHQEAKSVLEFPMKQLASGLKKIGMVVVDWNPVVVSTTNQTWLVKAEISIQPQDIYHDDIEDVARKVFLG